MTAGVVLGLLQTVKIGGFRSFLARFERAGVLAKTPNYVVYDVSGHFLSMKKRSRTFPLTPRHVFTVLRGVSIASISSKNDGFPCISKGFSIEINAF